jgi:hypothetical protein
VELESSSNSTPPSVKSSDEEERERNLNSRNPSAKVERPLARASSLDLTGVIFVDSTSTTSTSESEGSPSPGRRAAGDDSDVAAGQWVWIPSGASLQQLGVSEGEGGYGAKEEAAAPSRSSVFQESQNGGNGAKEEAVAPSITRAIHQARTGFAKAKAIAKRHPSQPTGNGLSNSGQWSQGSALHSSGTCKPCAWSWKPGGCEQGIICLFCHTCDEQAHKQYKKDRIVSVRVNRENKRVGSAALGPLQ